MKYRTKERAKVVLFIAAIATVMVASAIVFFGGAYCGWPWWTKMGMASQVWGVCK